MLGTATFSLVESWGEGTDFAANLKKHRNSLMQSEGKFPSLARTVMVRFNYTRQMPCQFAYFIPISVFEKIMKSHKMDFQVVLRASVRFFLLCVFCIV